MDTELAATLPAAGLDFDRLVANLVEADRHVKEYGSFATAEAAAGNTDAAEYWAEQRDRVKSEAETLRELIDRKREDR